MLYSRPETLIFIPCDRWPPWASSSPISVSPGCEQRVVDGGVGLGAGVRLDVGVLGAEQRLGPVDRQLLADVDELAAAVVALAGVALGVLVVQHRALALQHRHGREVLRGDHLQRPLLALQLARQHLGDLRVDLGQRAVEEVGGQLRQLTGRADTNGAAPVAATSATSPAGGPTTTARSRCSQTTRASNPASPSQSQLVGDGAGVVVARRQRRDRIRRVDGHHHVGEHEPPARGQHVGGPGRTGRAFRSPGR